MQGDKEPQTCLERFYDASAAGFATHLLEVCCTAGNACVAGIPSACDAACVSSVQLVQEEDCVVSRCVC
eukprot:SAG31_NODE_19708_length_592_cov_3.817814_1_plen_68_part_10